MATTWVTPLSFWVSLSAASASSADMTSVKVPSLGSKVKLLTFCSLKYPSTWEYFMFMVEVGIRKIKKTSTAASASRMTKLAVLLFGFLLKFVSLQLPPAGGCKNSRFYRPSRSPAEQARPKAAQTE